MHRTRFWGPVFRRDAAALVLLTSAISIAPLHAQQSTGGLQGTVKDPSGATVRGATVTLTGADLIGKKTLETNGSGYYQFQNLSPGTYTLTVTAPGFSTLERNNVVLRVNETPIINLALAVGAASATIEVTSAAPAIDVTSTTTQTNVTSEQIQYEPRGRSFESVMAFAPGTSYEPLQGGYSVNGAAMAENNYGIEGMSVNNIQDGTQQANLPFEFTEGVQLNTSGFQAQDGAALGGVVNAAMLRGSNKWHGQLVTYYAGDPMDANPTTTLRYDPQAAAPSTRVDEPIQFYTPKKDHYRNIQPGITLSGPLKTDRLWMALGFEPYYTSTRRTVNWNYAGISGSGAVSGIRTFTQDTQRDYAYARLDGAATQKIRLFGSWFYQYNRSSGTNLPTRDSIEGLYNASSYNNPDSYQHSIGNVQPNLVVNTGADITITPNLVSTTHFDYFYANYQDRGLPTGLRYVWSNSSQGATALDGTVIGSSNAAYHASGYATMSSNSATLANQNVTKSLREDVSYFRKTAIGVHNIKAGYQLRNIYQNVNTSYNTGLVNLYWGTGYSPIASFQANCATISQQNLQRYGNAGGTSTNCRGNYGYAVVSESGNIGHASENLHDIYVQDSWQVAAGVTINAGIRLEKEKLPSYNQYPSGIDWGFTDKAAPRLGAAWDVLRNGTLKLFGNYNVMYDVMKLNLAIGSFGGNYWHNCTYALDDTNYAAIQPARGSDGHYCAGTGNANFVGGTVPSNLRFIENQDYRTPANDPSSGTAVDPNIKPYREHEATAGVEFQPTTAWTVSGTYIRRRLDKAIEDAGLATDAGEQFQIVNPGFGNYRQPVVNCPTCKIQPHAERNYDALAIQARHIGSTHWQTRASYTYSRLRGNYSGLTQSDQSDGVGRNSPNNNRDFDEPFFQFTAAGNTFNGLLATDRPHRLQADGFYTTSTYLKRWKSALGIFEQALSGTPLSSYMSVGIGQSYPVYIEGHGKWVDVTADSNGVLTIGQPYVKRTPAFLQTDLNFTQDYKFSEDHPNMNIQFQAYIGNVFNQKEVTQVSQKINSGNVSSNYLTPPGYLNGSAYNYGVLEGPYDYRSLVNQTSGTRTGYGMLIANTYGKPMAWNGGRNMRLMIKFTF